jgi:PAS domain S-box-containing protein
MILNWMQKLGVAKTALAITIISILGSVTLEIGMSLIVGHLSPQAIVRCILFPGIITPIVSYAVVRVAVRLAKSETALRESEEKYRTILDNIEDGYFEVDRKGNFTFFNDSLCRLIGYSQTALMGMNNREYMDEENAKKVFQTFNRVYETGNSTKGFDWEITKVDGSNVRWMLPYQ